MSMTQRYAGMLRRQAADWDKREMPIQAECCRQAARHMETRELVSLLKDILHCSDVFVTFRPDLHARLLAFGRSLKAQEPNDDFPDDFPDDY